jgi:malate dehydrogenase (quinone)
MDAISDGKVGQLLEVATNMPIGTDVNFGELTRSMFNYYNKLRRVLPCILTMRLEN